MGSEKPSSLQPFKSFFARWRQFVEAEDARYEDIFRTEVGNLLSGFREAKILDIRQDRVYAPSFNLFNILLGKKTEAGHSAFIAELLNPDGSHGQGSVFLRESLNTCRHAGMPVDPESISTSGDLNVQTERPIYNGRLDISLESGAASFLLAIENKIDAADQEDQLERYWEWLDKRKDVFRSVSLAYLAPRGRRPDCKNVPFTLLTYPGHIAPWLERCRSLTQPLHVKIAIDEYTGVIKALPTYTGETDED
jgi:hypothetical protein